MAATEPIAEDERDRRTPRAPGDPQGRVPGEGAREVLPAGHGRPASARSAWAWVSQRNAMFGASSPRTSIASTSAAPQ
mgnify:CR=1 FL=1